MNKINILSLLLLAVFVFGCAPPKEMVNFDCYVPTYPAEMEKTRIADEDFYIFKQKDFTATFAIFGYQSLLVMYIELKNHTGKEIEAREYKLSLWDGRDRMPVKMITDKEIALISQKMANPGSFNLMSPSLQGAMSAVNSLASFPSQSALSSVMKQVRDNYFSLRPLYSNETRQGYIAFYHDFRLEYPLTFEIKIKDRIYPFVFVLKPDK